MTKESQVDNPCSAEDRIADETVFNQVLCDNDNTRLPSAYFSAVIAIICLAILSF